MPHRDVTGDGFVERVPAAGAARDAYRVTRKGEALVPLLRQITE